MPLWPVVLLWVAIVATGVTAIWCAVLASREDRP